MNILKSFTLCNISLIISLVPGSVHDKMKQCNNGGSSHERNKLKYNFLFSKLNVHKMLEISRKLWLITNHLLRLIFKIFSLTFSTIIITGLKK